MSWASIKSAIETVVLLDKLGVALGIGGFSAIVCGLWAHMTQLPTVLVAEIGLAAFVLAVLGFNGWRAFLKHRGRQRLNFTRWDRVAVLVVYVDLRAEVEH
jgi:hypothetical protein